MRGMEKEIRLRRVVLCILDGWGESEPSATNSITTAPAQHFDRLRALYPSAKVDTSGLEVGLPEGQMGNSEVGHMTIGGGRVFMQDLPRISQAIMKDEIWKNLELNKFIESCKISKNNVCHLLGLLSPGGVHSHIDHLIHMAKFLAKQGTEVSVHVFLDGRDTPPQSALAYLQDFEDSLKEYGNISINTVSGRYYAMDRDQRWDRLEKAFQAIVFGRSPHQYKNPREVVMKAYAAQVTDEFIVPAVKRGYTGIAHSDGIFMMNFRADRVIQLLSALVLPDFNSFDREGFCHQGPRLSISSYSQVLTPFWPPLFAPYGVTSTLGEVVSQAGLRQLRLAETEKFAHVTYFLNGGREDIFVGEERCLIPSPKVSSYDLKPEMSANEVCEQLIKAIESEIYHLIIVNFANADMVGHTGDLKATQKAILFLDNCLAKLEMVLISHDTTMLVTADHGNAEEMLDLSTQAPHTAHTLNLVPAVLINPPEKGVTLQNGTLADIAPTLLHLMGLPQPSLMSGISLIKEVGEKA